MKRLRILLASVVLAACAAQFDVAHEHHCLIEKMACGTCRVVVAQFAATPPATAAIHVPCDPPHAVASLPDVQPRCTALRNAFRLRAPPRS